VPSGGVGDHRPRSSAPSRLRTPAVGNVPEPSAGTRGLILVRRAGGPRVSFPVTYWNDAPTATPQDPHAVTPHWGGSFYLCALIGVASRAPLLVSFITDYFNLDAFRRGQSKKAPPPRRRSTPDEHHPVSRRGSSRPAARDRGRAAQPRSWKAGGGRAVRCSTDRRRPGGRCFVARRPFIVRALTRRPLSRTTPGGIAEWPTCPERCERFTEPARTRSGNHDQGRDHGLPSAFGRRLVPRLWCFSRFDNGASQGQPPPASFDRNARCLIALC